MADYTTIARPYAKAIFEHALAKAQLAGWSAVLHCLAQAVLDPQAKGFLANPNTTPEQQREVLLSAVTTTQSAVDQAVLKNFIALLTENKRFLVLPELVAQYEMFRAEQEKVLAVSVRSFTELTPNQQTDLASSLSKRLKRDITLQLSIDKSLLGGAVICAGDLVIDGSVLGKLKKLSADLAA